MSFPKHWTYGVGTTYHRDRFVVKDSKTAETKVVGRVKTASNYSDEERANYGPPAPFVSWDDYDAYVRAYD